MTSAECTGPLPICEAYTRLASAKNVTSALRRLWPANRMRHACGICSATCNRPRATLRRPHRVHSFQPCQSQSCSRRSRIRIPTATTRSAWSVRSSRRSARSAESRATPSELRALRRRRAGFRHDPHHYVPDRLCLELKSLKLYLWSFRERRDLLRARRESHSR